MNAEESKRLVSVPFAAVGATPVFMYTGRRVTRETMTSDYNDRADFYLYVFTFSFTESRL